MNSMRGRAVKIAAVVSVALLAACSGIRVRTEHDPARDLGRYTTYAWYAPRTPTQDGTAVALAEDVELRLIAAVDAGLVAKGLKRVAPPEAELRVRYRVQVEERIQFNDPYYAADLETPYEEGALILDLVDADDGERAWRGVARARLREKATKEQRTQRAVEAVGAILDRYPARR